MPVGRISTSIRSKVKKSVILKARSAPMCGGIQVKFYLNINIAVDEDTKICVGGVSSENLIESSNENG